MRISLIVAVAENGVIGANNHLPWKLPADLKHFKQLTLRHSMIMGRKTFDSIGTPLPGRTNIVMTHQKETKIDGALVAHSLEKALLLAGDAEEIFVIGGAALFAQALPFAGRIYLTRIHHDFEGDTTWQELDSAHWHETSRQDFSPDAQNPYPYSFLILEKND